MKITNWRQWPNGCIMGVVDGEDRWIRTSPATISEDRTRCITKSGSHYELGEEFKPIPKGEE